MSAVVHSSLGGTIAGSRDKPAPGARNETTGELIQPVSRNFFRSHGRDIEGHPETRDLFPSELTRLRRQLY
jgi:hypothetical protein